MKKIMVTGAFGQIGSELVPELQKKYGKDQVIALGHRHISSVFDGTVEKADVCNETALEKIIKKHNIGTIYHLVSLRSIGSEKNPDLAWKINVDGLKNVLDLAKEYGIRIFWPSSVCVFGPTTPRISTPQKTVLEPITMYGITKLTGENMCHYYNLKYGVDVRSVRYPALISWETKPGGGVSDFASYIYYQAIKHGKYESYLSEKTRVPVMYMKDAIGAMIKLMNAGADSISVRTSYNLTGFSLTVKDMAHEIQKHIPLSLAYVSDFRQKIVDTLPESIDDSQANIDWGWKPKYELAQITREMLSRAANTLQI